MAKKSKERRCWETTVGKKKRILCSDDKLSKRKFIRDDINNHLEDCTEAIIDGERTRYMKPDSINYGIQVGAIKKIKCIRRGKRRGCRDVELQVDKDYVHKIKVCDDDPAGKKVDIHDTVDSILTGCTRARFWKENGKKDTFTVSRTGGLSEKDRRMAGRFVTEGDVTKVRCILKTKKTVK